MKIKISNITACILRDYCQASAGLIQQINGLPVKADTVYLQVEQGEMKRAVVALKQFMESSNNYHTETFESVLREVEYFTSNAT